MTERKLFLVRVQSNALPSTEYPSRKLGLPDALTGELNQGNWRVINHAVAPDPSGGLMLSLYCEREV